MRSSWKTIVLWVVLIAFFIAVYQVFSRPGPEGSTTGPAVERSGPSWAQVCTPVFVLLLVAGALWFRRGQQTIKLSNEGVNLLNQGRYSLALEKFELAGKRAKKSPISPFNIGVTQLMLWRISEARSQLERALQLTKENAGVVVIHAGSPERVKLVAPPFLALISALQGDVPAGREWLARLGTATEPSGQAGLAKAALECRAGDFATAVRTLDAFEVKQQGGAMGALGSALRAWAIERTTGELRHVDRVLLFGETGPQVLSQLWPELAAFVERAPAG